MCVSVAAFLALGEHSLVGKMYAKVTQKACGLWKAMNSVEKEKYEALAKKDKDRYEKAVEALKKLYSEDVAA